MSELNELGCARVADVAAELALGVLSGCERVRVLAHLDWCGACRENVCRLTMTGEALLGLLPGSEPPLGFEAGAMARTGLSHAVPVAGARTRGWRRVMAVAACSLRRTALRPLHRRLADAAVASWPARRR